MRLLSVILIAAVSNLDNLGVGVALGIRGSRIAAIPNLIIAALTMAGTAGAMSSGGALSSLIAPSTAASLGSLIVIGVGAATVLAPLVPVRARAGSSARGGRSAPGGRGRSELVSLREALALGIALSLNNIASGIGAGVAGIPPLATTLLAGALSLLWIGGGTSLGRLLGRPLLGARAPLAAGLALVAVGAALLSGLR